ncbi:MAG: N-acetyltransferase [Clostridia bacterium]|nr:N-acetyltransferase [Clostridia bacterium]
MPEFVVRSEAPGDYEQISRIHSLAFGHDWEANLILDLRRDPSFDPDMSLVADLDGKAVGHICFSKITIETPVSSAEAVILAPLAILEEYRSLGAGSALVTEGIRRCKKRGFRIMLVYGGPYYERFGFRTAHEQGIFRPNPMPGEVVRMLELVPGALEGVRGVIKYPNAFKPLVNQWYPD